MMLMEEFKISPDIYQESLSLNSFRISDDVFKEAEELTIDSIRQEIEASYRFSGRFWIWKLGVLSYSKNWKRMFEANEMQMDAPGFKYLLSYNTLTDFQVEYARKHPDRQGITTVPAAYYSFAKFLRRGDVVIVCGSSTNIIAWGIIEGEYRFRPTYKNGRHYRKVSWTKMDMPFIFMNKRQMLYQILAEETHQLKDALINKVFQHSNILPFGFVDSGYEMEIPFTSVVKKTISPMDKDSLAVETIVKNNNQKVDDVKKKQILNIIAALQKSFR